jgi:hypothetical protein
VIKARLGITFIVLMLACLMILPGLPAAGDDGASTDASVTVVSGGAGGGGGGGGGGSSRSTKLLIDYTDENGEFFVDVVVESLDGCLWLDIPQGTVGKKSNGQRITSMSIEENDMPPAPPEDSGFICLAYDIEPSGATFDPPIYLSFKYEDAQIPAGVSEANLVLATWLNGAWVELEGGSVDTVNNIITVPISHLSTYTAIAYTSPASFTVRDLTVTPSEVHPGEAITVNVSVANTGDLVGSLELILRINDVITQTQTVAINGRGNQSVSFSMDSGPAGEYTVAVNGLSMKFTVKNPEPQGTVAEVTEPEPSSEPPPTQPQTVEPTQTATPPAATEPTPTGTPTPTSTGEPTRETDFRPLIVSGSIGFVLILTVMVVILVRKRPPES